MNELTVRLIYCITFSEGLPYTIIYTQSRCWHGDTGRTLRCGMSLEDGELIDY